jgi:hypothetical protein
VRDLQAQPNKPAYRLMVIASSAMPGRAGVTKRHLEAAGIPAYLAPALPAAGAAPLQVEHVFVDGLNQSAASDR